MDADVCMYEYMYVCMWSMQLYVLYVIKCMYIVCTWEYVYICICMMYEFEWVRTHLCVYEYIFMCVCVCQYVPVLSYQCFLVPTPFPPAQPPGSINHSTATS